MNETIKKKAGKLTEAELIMKAKKDKRYKQYLMKKYFSNACKWATKHMNRVIYADIPRMTQEEISSMVNLAFENALQRFDPSKTTKLSFKNYFYLMIKYQGYSEVKVLAGHWLIKNYDDEVSSHRKEEEDNDNFEMEHIHQISCRILAERILCFLGKKNLDYVEIMLLKSKGFKNKDICETLGIDPISLKAKIQYIRKLVREEFGDGDGFF